MGGGIFLVTLLALFVLILSPISYFILNKLNLRKLGITISLVLASIVIIPSFAIIFESQLYFKGDARNDLKELGIILTDDFRIIDNAVHSAGNDIYQFTKLEISINDRSKIISSIKKSKNFRVLNVEKSLADEMQRIESRKVTSNYSLRKMYIRESYEKEKGYVPIRLTINVTDSSNIIKLTRVD